MSSAVDYVGAYLAGVSPERSSPVLLGFVVEEALFGIVLVRYLTLLSLEVIEIYVTHYIALFGGIALQHVDGEDGRLRLLFTGIREVHS